MSGGADFEPQARAIVETPSPIEVSEAEGEAVASAVVIMAKEDPVATAQASLASIPTTRRLIGEATETPENQRVVLGPTTSDQKQQENVEETVFSLASYAQPAPDFRFVKGNRVNMRVGPGTEYSVVGTLVRDSQVEVLQDPGFGWVKLLELETGRIGWMSASLLTKLEG